MSHALAARRSPLAGRPVLAPLAVLVVVLFCGLGSAGAQSPPQWGLPRFGATDHLTTAAVYVPAAAATLTIPIFAKAGRGPGFAVAMVYNSNFYWNQTGTAFAPNPDTNSPWLIEPNTGAVFFDAHSVSQRDGRGYCLYG